jgi:hypothetical protein
MRAAKPDLPLGKGARLKDYSGTLGAGNTQAHQQDLSNHFATFPHFSPQRFGVYTANDRVVKVKYSQKLTIFNLSKNGFRVSGKAKKPGIQGDGPGVLLELLE